MSDKKLPLKDGVVGRVLVQWFQDWENKTPIAAESLGVAGKDQMQYRMTFEDGSVSDWLVTFERTMTMDMPIASAEMFNEVL